MKYCQNCGEANDDNALFCRYCGFPFDEVEEEPQYDDYDDRYIGVYDDEASSSHTGLIITLVIMAVILFVGIFVFFVFYGTQSDTDDTYVEDTSQTAESTPTPVQSYSASTTSGWTAKKDMSRIYTATASSSIPMNENGYTYIPENAIDGSEESAWLEYGEGPGEGEWIAFQNTSGQEQTITTIYFLVGYMKTQEIFDQNTAPTKVDVSVGSSPSGAKKIADISLSPTRSAQYASLNKTISLKPNEYIVFTIRGASIGPYDTDYDAGFTEIYLD